jgi:DNA primase catalytic core
MARIPDAEIERLKEVVSLVALAEAAGVSLTRHGADWHGRCPFHDDTTPSLVITPAKGLWHCLGACNTGGSAIDWMMRARGVPFRRAVELLRAEAGLLPIEAAQSAAVPPRSAAKVVAPLVASADDAALLEDVIGVYHATLQQHAEAQAYLARRGLTHPELIAAFRLGVADRTLAYRLPEKQIAAGAAVRGQLQRLGLLRSTGHELFTGSLVVPVTDAAGAVVNVYGRKLADKQREGVPLHLYLPGPQRGVFNLAGWRGSEDVILCEALLDALTFWCAGYRNVTSAYGVHGFTDELLQALVTHGVRRVLIAFDRDEAGDNAADALALKLAAHGIDSLRVLFPKGMDANAYALKVGPAAQSLGLVLKQAVPLGKANASPERRSTPLLLAASPASNARSSLAAAVASDPPPTPVLPQIESPPIAAPVASRATPATGDALAVEVSEQQAVIVYGDRRYRVRGLAKNLSADTLRVNVLASRGEGLHVDTFDLYAAKARAVFAKQTASAFAIEEAVIERDLARLLLQLEDLQDATIRNTLTQAPAAPTLTPEQHDAAMQLLRDPTLAQRIVHDVAAIGVVGEDSNALVGYLAAVSRKLERPLAILIQSTSASGKSTLMDALLSLMPEAERVHYSAMTGQSLFYLGEGDLKHKILAIAEEEGVRQAAYALKLLQSQGELTIASTGKDPTTGKLVTEEYRVEGPVMLLLTTTAIDIDEELLNRCLVLTINESREQTVAIHARQRSARTLSGLLATKHAEAIRSVHRAAQTLLRPLAVVNPYAEALTFRSESTRMRRDHAKYLTLIDAIALLHQHQRPIQSAAVGGAVIEYIEVTLADIALANRLAHDVLGRSLDALPPQTRRLLGAIVRLVAERCGAQRIDRRELRLGRADVRAVAGVSETQLRLHLERLVDMDYLLVHRGQRGQSFVYELLFDGAVDDTASQLVGLVDAEALRDPGTFQSSRGESPSSRGVEGEFAGSSRPQRGGIAASSRGVETVRNASAGAADSSLVAAVEESARLRTLREPATQHRANGAARTS